MDLISLRTNQSLKMTTDDVVTHSVINFKSQAEIRFSPKLIISVFGMVKLLTIISNFVFIGLVSSHTCDIYAKPLTPDPVVPLYPAGPEARGQSPPLHPVTPTPTPCPTPKILDLSHYNKCIRLTFWTQLLSIFLALTSGIMYICYLFHFCEKYYNFPWLTLDCFLTGICTLLYFITSFIILAIGFQENDTNLQTASGFGLSIFLFCLLNTILDVFRWISDATPLQTVHV